MPGDEEIRSASPIEERIVITLSRIDQDLPTIPIILSRLMHLSTSEDTSINEIVEVIKHDQALTTRILRVANSAYYSPREKVTTIDRALVILGFDRILALALSVSLINHFSPKSRCEGFELGLFWAHTIAVAVFSEILARQWDSIDPGDAFTAGILHDIGKLVMLIYFEEEFKQVLKKAADAKIDFFLAEMSELGVNHAFVASILLRHWDIPEILVGAIENHHQLLVPEDDLRLTACVNFANFAAKYIPIGKSGSQYFDPPSLELHRRTGYSVAEFKAYLQEMKDHQDEVYSLISALGLLSLPA
jgi:putative nucleotidyltransferase with HDIG domain